MAKSKKKTKKQQQKDQELYMYILAVIGIALCIIAFLKLGMVGQFLYNLFCYIFGDYFYIVLGVVIIFAVIVLINKKKGSLSRKTVFAAVFLLLALFLWSALACDPELNGFEIINDFMGDTTKYFMQDNALPTYGGIIGAFLLSLSTILVARQGSYLIIVVLVLIAALLIVPISFYKSVFASIKRFFSLPEKFIKDRDEDEEDEEYEDDTVYEDEYEEEPEEQEEEIEEEPEPVVRPQARYAGALDDDRTPVRSTSSVFIDVDDPSTAPIVDEDEDDYEPEDEPDTTTVMGSSERTQSSSLDIESQRKVNGPYRIPGFNLLEPFTRSKGSQANGVAAKEKGQRLIEILADFGIEAKLMATHIGPAVTKFEVKPESSVKVNKILGLADNIKMELAARDIRIEAPIPGRSAVGIEIPNVESTPVKMKEVITQIPDELKSKKLLFVLGKDLMGQPVFCQLDKMPHLLIAGATGSGKSVCMNTIITSLLLRTSPDDVKMLLVDPKKVEFTQYAKIPHLIGPVISDPTKASNALKVIVQIMEQRYEVFSKVGVRNIQVYNDKIKEEEGTEDQLQPMPYIVVIIDELADLMAVAGKEVESSIQRITQLARAAGIHLIVATQRPSTDVITGIIKANIPSRIAFSVSSGIDSRTILDHVGAERLLGNGDMLYLPIGEPSAIRLQGVYVTDEEVRKVSEYASKQRVPMYNDAFIRLEGVGGNEDTAVMGASEDPLFDEIKEYVIDVQKASTSLLQRRFGIGYNRAARMIDVLEDNGVIGPQQGSKPREVYIKKDDTNDE